MFRDSESYIQEALKRLDLLEEHTEAAFEYFFYENDSEDNTVGILTDWLKNKEGSLLSENLGRPKFSQSSSVERQVLMTDYRSRLLNNCKPLESDFSFLLDSDVIYEPNIINRYIAFLNDHTDVVMVTPNIKQNIKCKMFDGTKDSYYDSWALVDTNGNLGMTWAYNPFYSQEDRSNWDSNQPVKVNSAFGGCPLIKTEVLNEIHWATEGGCEHWHFCKMAREYGDVVVVPDIEARVEIEDMLFPNEYRIVEHQKQKFSLLSIL